MDESSAERSAEAALFAGEARLDPIGKAPRERVRGCIGEPLEQGPTEAPGRPRHGRGPSPGHRHGRRERRPTGSFGPVASGVPRARPRAEDGTTGAWRGATPPRHARRTRRVEAPIAGARLAGTDTRRVRRALVAPFRGAVGKGVVGRAWRELTADREARCRRDPAGEGVVRPILDGTVGRARVDRKAAGVSLPVALGGRGDGRKVLLAVKDTGGEGEAARRAVLDDPIARGSRTPGFLPAARGRPGS